MPPATAEMPAMPYDATFFDDQAAESGRSAAVVVPIVMDLVKPASVLDVGCGVGAWLKVFAALGVHDFLGLDGDYVDPSRLLIDTDHFRAADLANPPKLDRTFDLAVCLEVAEHLPARSAVRIVELLTDAAPAVLFSAAFPGQGGTYHINEQWPAYWRERFHERGYVRLDPVRPRVWSDPHVMPWFKMNTFLYVRESSLASRPEWAEEHRLAKANPYELVSAWHLERNLPLTLGRAIKALPGLAWKSLTRRLS